MNQQLLKKLEPYVVVNPEVMKGSPRFKKTRIPVSLVLDHLAKGWSVDDIKKIFPDLKLSIVKKTISIISSEL